MHKTLLWGARGHTKVINEAIDKSKYEPVVLGDNSYIVDPCLPWLPFVLKIEGLLSWMQKNESNNPTHFVVGIGGGNGKARLEVMNDLMGVGLKPITIVHPKAYLSDSAQLSDGVQILAMAAVSTDVKLGKGVIINTSASVDHDCELSDGVHIAPGAHLAGEIFVGKNVFVGTGAVILPRTYIGDDSIIGAGAVVLNDVDNGSVVVGNPAKVKIF